MVGHSDQPREAFQQDLLHPGPWHRGAWQQAIAARQEFQVHCQDRFVIQCPEATADAMRRFPELLEHAGRLPETDAARDAMYRQLLDAWFDAMRPLSSMCASASIPYPAWAATACFSSRDSQASSSTRNGH